MDELVARSMAMDLENEEDHEYYGAGLENVLASAGVATSQAPPLPEHDPIDHTGVGVHVSGVSIQPIVVEDSLWGEPVEDKKKKKDDVLLCELHGKVCSRGICKVYEKQLREQRKKAKEEQDSQKDSQNWRNGTSGPNNGRGGRGGRGAVRGTRGAPLRGRGGFGKDSGPRSPGNGEFCHAYFPGCHVSTILSQISSLLKGPMAALPPETRGSNPAATPRLTLLGGPTITRGAQARWPGLTDLPKNLIPTRA